MDFCYKRHRLTQMSSANCMDRSISEAVGPCNPEDLRYFLALTLAIEPSYAIAATRLQLQTVHKGRMMAGVLHQQRPCRPVFSRSFQTFSSHSHTTSLLPNLEASPSAQSCLIYLVFHCKFLTEGESEWLISTLPSLLMPAHEFLAFRPILEHVIKRMT